MYFYSLIIPVFNRPSDLREVLEGLAVQTYKNFEVIVVESGSEIKSDQVVEEFKDRLTIHYYYKANEGQGISRNYGMARANGEYFIILDSDLIIPENYLEIIDNHLQSDYLDAFGGPDRGHPDFSPVQKAVDYALTSYLTTGGARGKIKKVGHYHPRSFNMGMSRETFEKTGGFKLPYCGEDIELSIRMIKSGYKVGLIPDAFVYHKRKDNFSGFFKQMQWFGKSRINVLKYFPDSFSPVYLLPAAFCLFLLVVFVMAFVNTLLFQAGMGLLILYLVVVVIHASVRYRSFKVGVYSIVTALSVFIGYTLGLMDFFRR